jgi:hypothetical protein
MTLQNVENFTVFSGADFLEKIKALQTERRMPPYQFVMVGKDSSHDAVSVLFQ